MTRGYLQQTSMLRTVWAKVARRRRLYLIDERCDFVMPVKLYVDHLAALEKSPHTLENYCRHLGRYFAFLHREGVDWRSIRPDDLVRFIQRLRDEHTTVRRTNKSDSAKDAQIVRFKERIKRLEDQVRTLKEENELLYGKLSERAFS
jgi:predicted RNase H-like nuclease (RuvC/YqgF family)